MRIVPYMPLSSTTMITGILYCTAVANSCPFIRKSPSPQATLDLASIPERIQTEVQRAIQHSIKGVEYFSTSGPALGSTPKDMLHSRGTMQRSTDSTPRRRNSDSMQGMLVTSDL
jgi:hypothetical protein